MFKSTLFPILIALIYIIVILPIGIFFRLLGKDFLRQKFDNNIKTYWIEKKQRMGSMKSQFKG